jgi:DNA-binding MarR family transcriptional regulator
VHQTTAVPAISILERNGYVGRERSSEDKRNVFVYLTDAGKLLAHELIPVASEINQKSLTGISPEEADQLMALLLKIQRNLQAVSWDPGCMAV